MPRRDASDPFAALTPYEVRNLIEHLVRAGRREAVHRLLAMEGPQGSGWYDLKQRTDDDRGYERDLAVAWQLADAQFREAPDGSQRTIAIALQIRYAMITGSLGRVSDRLTPEDLRDRLAGGEWSMSRARATAARASDATVRARMFAELAGVGEDGDVREVIADALSDPSRPLVLAAVSRRLAPETLPAIPEAARALGEEALADALVAVAPRMPATDIEPWLREAIRLKGRDALARALVALAPRGPAAAADDVVLESGLLDDEQAALGLLEALAPGLSPVAAERALEAIRRLPPSARRARAAVVLLEAIPPDRRGGGLEAERRAAGRIRARDQRAVALAALGAGAKALEVAAGIHPAERGATITAIAPRLAPALASKAIQLVSELPSPTVRGETLLALAPIVDASSTLAALKVVEGVKPASARARLLATLASRLPEARLTRALSLTLAIRDVETRAVALAAIEPRLTDRHRATPKYRRRAPGAAGVDVDAVLRGWEEASSTRPAPPVREAPPPVARAVADDHEAVPEDGDRLDGQARRRRLIERIRTEQADYAALRAWLVKVLSSDDRRGSLSQNNARDAWALGERLAASVRERHQAAGPSSHGARRTASEATVRRRLREQLTSRLVELSDPRIQAALDVADPITLRTALHLGLELAETREDDDGLFDERYTETPTMVDVVPVFARHGRLREVVDAARDLTGPYRRAEALAAALPYLATPDREALAGEALASVITACRDLSPRMWWRRLDVLEALAPVVDDQGLEAMAAELRRLAGQSGSSVPPGDSRLAILIEAQLLLMLHAGPRTVDRHAVDGLRTALRVRSETVREAVLDAFTPLLTQAALDAGAAMARRLSSGRRQALALAVLARRAAEIGATAKGSELIEEIARLPDLFVDPTTAAVLGRHATLLTPTALAAVWCPAPGEGLLHGGPRAPRDDLVRALDGLAPALALLGGPDASLAVEDASGVVARWWP